MRNAPALILATMAFVTPAAAQEWGSDYNMGSIGITGGTPADGTITIDCAEAGNAVVPQGSLSIWLQPAVRAIGAGSPADELTFAVDGTELVLPVSAEEGSGFVFNKTAETLDLASQLIGLLQTGTELVVTGESGHLARIDLQGAAAALDGVEVCLTPEG